MKLALARAFIEAVAAHDLEAAEEFLDPDVETSTPRGTLHGIAAARQVLAKPTGDEQFAVEQTKPDFEEIEGEIVARTREIAHWRETGEIAYQRDFAVRLTHERENRQGRRDAGGRGVSIGRLPSSTDRSTDHTRLRSGENAVAQAKRHSSGIGRRTKNGSPRCDSDFAPAANSPLSGYSTMSGEACAAIIT